MGRGSPDELPRELEPWALASLAMSPGTVTMLGASQRRGLPCREMRYTITTARAVSPLEVNFTVCRMPDGAWKLAG